MTVAQLIPKPWPQAVSVPPAPVFDVAAATQTLADQLAATAVARDREGGHPEHERGLIRASGLLNLTIPREFGGHGAALSSFYQVLRKLATADSALAHVFGFHHLQLASVRLFGTRDQQQRLLTDTVQHQLFWGNAANPLDKRASAVETAGGYVFHGSKSYSSGSVGSDRLLISGWHEATQSRVIAVVATRHPGVTVTEDWDAFGQKQTDSGTVTFEQVRVPHADVLQGPGVVQTPRATLRTLVSQLILTNLYLGLGLGAFDEARRLVNTLGRANVFSSAERAVHDPYVQHRIADLWLLLRPAAALADQAAKALDDALSAGDRLQAADRGEVAVEVAQAKVLAHRAALEVSSQFFELTGARATSGRLGLDRFWRNARVHTLHDPVDYKYRDLGRYLLEGLYPEPTSYS